MTELIAGPTTPQEVAVELNNRLVREKRALEAENARLLAVCQEICRLLTDSEEHSYGEIYTSAVDGLKGDDSALKAMLDAAREEARHQQALESVISFGELAKQRDAFRAQLADAQVRETALSKSVMKCAETIEKLSAQVERLRGVADDVVQGGGIADLEDARAALAETPAASLAAVCEQARREALGVASIATAVLDFLAEQKYQGEEILHAIIACDFASRRHMEDAIARVIRDLAAQPVKEPQS